MIATANAPSRPRSGPASAMDAYKIDIMQIVHSVQCNPRGRETGGGEGGRRDSDHIWALANRGGGDIKEREGWLPERKESD